jgi:putative oxidoreductase
MSANMNAATSPAYGASYGDGYNPGMMLVGRILLAAIFLVAGTRKLLTVAATTAYMTKLGFPAPEVVTWIAIVIEIGAGLMLLTGWRTRIAAWALILFVAIATAMAHRFWEFEPAQMQNQLNHFLKNLAVIGGLLFVATCGPGRMSVDKA